MGGWPSLGEPGGLAPAVSPAGFLPDDPGWGWFGAVPEGGLEPDSVRGWLLAPAFGLPWGGEEPGLGFWPSVGLARWTLGELPFGADSFWFVPWLLPAEGGGVAFGWLALFWGAELPG